MVYLVRNLPAVGEEALERIGAVAENGSFVSWVAALISAVAQIYKTVTESRQKRRERESAERREAELEVTQSLRAVMQSWENPSVKDAIRYVRLASINLQVPDAYSAMMYGFPPGAKLQTVFRFWEDVSRQMNSASLIVRLSPDIKQDCLDCWKCLNAVAQMRRQGESDFALGFERLARSCGYTD